MNEKIQPTSNYNFYETVIRYMKAGILHGKRNCLVCGFPMKLGPYGWVSFSESWKERMNWEFSSRVDNLFWMCTLCGYTMNIKKGSLMTTGKVKHWDRALRLFAETPAISHRILSGIVTTSVSSPNYKLAMDVVNLAMKSLAHFWQTRIKPYLVLPGIVEIDETKVGCERGMMIGVTGKHPIFKWVLGMYCRRTRLAILYYIKNRKTHHLYPKFKRNIREGSIVITDEHASYMCTVSMQSRLTKLGYFHYFINHNAAEYVHRKFPFVQTMGIEGLWNRVKRGCPTLKHKKLPVHIDSTVDQYCTRLLVQQDKFYDFVLSKINGYYFDMLHKYQMYTSYQDPFHPDPLNIYKSIEFLEAARTNQVAMSPKWLKKMIQRRKTHDIEELAYIPRLMGEIDIEEGFLRMMNKTKAQCLEYVKGQYFMGLVVDFSRDSMSFDRDQCRKDHMAEDFRRTEIDISSVTSFGDLYSQRAVKRAYRNNRIRMGGGNESPDEDEPPFKVQTIIRPQLAKDDISVHHQQKGYIVPSRSALLRGAAQSDYTLNKSSTKSLTNPSSEVSKKQKKKSKKKKALESRSASSDDESRDKKKKKKRKHKRSDMHVEEPSVQSILAEELMNAISEDSEEVYAVQPKDEFESKWKQRNKFIAQTKPAARRSKKKKKPEVEFEESSFSFAGESGGVSDSSSSNCHVISLLSSDDDDQCYIID